MYYENVEHSLCNDDQIHLAGPIHYLVATKTFDFIESNDIKNEYWKLRILQLIYTY